MANSAAGVLGERWRAISLNREGVNNLKDLFTPRPVGYARDPGRRKPVNYAQNCPLNT